MKRSPIAFVSLGLFLALVMGTAPAVAQWVTRDHRWQPRGPWNWALPRELPQLYREFNGIDFGHAHLAETLLRTQDQQQVERARLEILDFIFSSPAVPPDEEQVAPTFTRMVWEAQRAFNWAHTFHRSLYDLFASDDVEDKQGAYRELLANYLEKPEGITSHRLDHHGKLWSFPESKAFRDKFRKFNTQIWAYHWLQAAVYDVQLMGNAARQRELMPRIIVHYHGYLRNPPIEWQFMPMLPEGAPDFTARFPEAAAIFDNLHMLHDNIDDVLSRPDLYPTVQAKREAILRILPIYLHRNHVPDERYAESHEPGRAGAQPGHEAMGHGQSQVGHGMMMQMGLVPPRRRTCSPGGRRQTSMGHSLSHSPSLQRGKGRTGAINSNSIEALRERMPMPIRPPILSVTLLSAVALGIGSTAYAIDHKNLDEGRPVRLEDAYPIASGELALEAGGGFNLQRDSPDRAAFPLQVLYGAAPNLQLSLGATLLTHPREIDDQTKSGDLQVSGLYNFNQETLTLPAFGLKLTLNVPTGIRSSGLDVEVKGLVTKSFDRFSLHFNAAYAFLHGVAREEREGRYQLVLGASYPVGAPQYTRTTLVGDLFTKQSGRTGRSNIFGAEVGFRHQLTQRVVWDAGIGTEFAGPGDRSPFFFTTGFSIGF